MDLHLPSGIGAVLALIALVLVIIFAVLHTLPVLVAVLIGLCAASRLC